MVEGLNALAGRGTSRLAALDSYDILNSPPEASFDDVVYLASQLCDTPTALVTFLAADRQWFKARVGFDACETPLDQSVCRHALEKPGLLIIPNLTLDPRTRGNALVTGEPGIRFYAGYRLETSEGEVLGMLCVIDTTTRLQGLTPGQVKGLEVLARQVMSLLELRRSAERHRTNEEFMRTVLQSSEDCIKILDLDANLLFMSEGGKRVMEVDDFDAIQGCPWPEFWIGEKHGEALAAIAAAKANSVGHFQGLADTMAGTPKWWDVRVTPILDAQGKPEKLLSISRDVTAMRKADIRRHAILELGDRLRDMEEPAEMAFAAAEIMGRNLQATRAGYGTIDPAGEAISIDRDWTVPGSDSLAGTHLFRSFGTFNRDLKRGRTVIVGDVRADARTNANSDMLEAVGVRSVVNLPVFEHGRFVALFYLNDTKVRDWSAEEVAFIANIADRTRAAIERKHAEDRLRDINADLERRVADRTRERDRVWRNSQDLLVVIDAKGTFLSVSPAALRILGRTPEEMLGRTVFDFIHDDDLPSTDDALETAKHDELPTYLNRYRHRDGGYRWISWVAAPEDGLIYAYGRDVSAEKEQAKALQQAEEQLRQAQKMEAVGQLTGGVAHDFNNLLTVIRSSVDLLMRPNLSEERRQRYIEAISQTTTRATKLTGQLLAFARRQALQPEVFDVASSIETIRDMVGTLTGARIDIATRVFGDGLTVDADPSQFDTALVNLAVNARDAMNGEGRLEIAVAAAATIPAMRSHPARHGDFVAVSVSDTGSGISAENLAVIFEPFFTTKGVGHGTGLGLSQVIGFAKQSGGDVAVESEVGRGTTFTLYLPRADAVAERREEASDAEPLVNGHGLRVLVVEDNEDVGSFATQTLKELGYDTTLSSDAADALANLTDGEAGFDVVFSDVVMPGMNGIELGQEIRRRHPDLPVVLTSGYSHVLAKNGTYGFELLQKPYSVEQLSRVLSKAVTWRRRRRAGTR